MSSPVRAALAAGAMLALNACGQEAGQELGQAPAERVVLQSSMAEILSTQDDLVNRLIEALDATGKVDPHKLDAEDWAMLMATTARLRDVAVGLRDGDIAVVDAPGEQIEGEGSLGALGAADVQARIDADPASFKAHAGALAVGFEALAAAAVARDVDTLWDGVLDVDPLCAPCHTQYWYPETPP